MENNGNTTTFLRLLKEYEVNIPRIQRDYAQGREQKTTEVIRSRFLDKLLEGIQAQGSVHLDFVYGLERPGVAGEKIFLPIDGQQRLTTLFLLHWYFLDAKDVGCLENFRYETRSTTAAFLCMLLEKRRDILLDKKDDAKLSKIIQDKNWFQASWKYDPSISGMLVTLDAIEKKSKDANLEPRRASADRLKQITFDLILLDKETDPDLLYRKINSRGRKLTDYENFKAELFQALDELELDDKMLSGERNTFKQNLDTLWSDYVFCLTMSKDRTEAVDKALLNLFCSHARIFLWNPDLGKSDSHTPANEKQSETAPKATTTDYLRAQYYLDKIKEKGSLESFVSYFHESMGWWTSGSYDDTIVSYVASSKKDIGSQSPAGMPPIVVNFEGEETNPFNLICRSEDSLSTLCFFYAIGELGRQLGKQNLSENQIHKRLLLLRNFLFNAGLEERHMPVMISFIRDLMEKGSSVVLDGPYPSNSGIKQPQWQQEKTKLVWRSSPNNGDEDLKTLAALENHDLLRGDVSVVITGNDASSKRATKLLEILPEPGKVGNENRERALLTFALSCTAKDFIYMGKSVSRYLLYDTNVGYLRDNLRSAEGNDIKGNLRIMLEEFVEKSYESLDGYLDALVRGEQDMDYRAYLIKYRERLLTWGLELNDKGTVKGWKYCYFSTKGNSQDSTPAFLRVSLFRVQKYRRSWFWCLPELICMLCEKAEVIGQEYDNKAMIRVNDNDGILCDKDAFVIGRLVMRDNGKPDEYDWLPLIRIKIPQSHVATDKLDRVLLGCAIVRALQKQGSEEGQALQDLRQKARENAGQQTAEQPWVCKLPGYDISSGELVEDSTPPYELTVEVINDAGTQDPAADTDGPNQEGSKAS